MNRVTGGGVGGRLALSVAEYRLLAEAWLLATLVRQGLRWIRFNTLLSWLERLACAGRRRPETAISQERAARIVAAARSVGQTCLTRALVLRQVLERRGVAADLLVSARRSDQQFEAHVSMRVGDRTLLGDDARDSEPLWRHGFVPRRSGP